MDFATARQRTEDLVTDLPDATLAMIPAWINVAVRDAETRHNFRHMEARLAAAVVAGDGAIAKPADWKEARTSPWIAHADGRTTEIRWAPSESEMVRWYHTDSEGIPAYVLELATAFDTFPMPDDAYDLVLPYWAYSPELVTDGDTNPVLGPDFGLFVPYRAAAYALMFNDDDGTAEKNMGLSTQWLASAIRKDRRSRVPNRMTLYPRRDVYGPALAPRRPR